MQERRTCREIDGSRIAWQLRWSLTGPMRRWRVVEGIGASVADRLLMQEVIEPVRERLGVHGWGSQVSAGAPTGYLGFHVGR